MSFEDVQSEGEKALSSVHARDEADKSTAAHWAATYDLLRPSSEIDSRSNLVLASSLALIALCLSSQKSDMIASIFGFSFQTKRWLILAVPLVLIVFYACVQLGLAWWVHSRHTKNARFDQGMSELLRLEKLQFETVEGKKKWLAECDKIHRKRAEHKASDGASGIEQHEDQATLLYNNLKKEIRVLERRSTETLAHLKLADRFWAAGQALSLWFPLTIAAIAIGIFAVTVFAPGVLKILSL
jgi:hypothetical protein